MADDEALEFWEDPAFDKRTYWGRVRSFQHRMNPMNIFISQSELDAAKQTMKLPAYPGCERERRKADAIVKAAMHPQTGETIMPLARISAFVPVNLPICGGLLFARPTIPNLVGWQWINQTYNALFNYCQGNKSKAEQGDNSWMQYKDLITGYVCASVVSVGLSVGSTIWLKRSRMSDVWRKRLQLTVPYTAVASAGVANVVLMRSKELVDGIPVYVAGKTDCDEPLGYSKVAAKYAVLQTAISRVVLPIPILALPPPILALCYRISFIQASATMRKLVEMVVLMAGLWVGLPCAVAIFPQAAKLPIEQIESKLRQRASVEEGDRNAYVYFNKGV